MTAAFIHQFNYQHLQGRGLLNKYSFALFAFFASLRETIRFNLRKP
jgi:hypothetical protein